MSILVQALLIGVAVGVVVGALGAGGGILSVPVLVHLLHQDPHAAAASSLVIVGATALASLPHHARHHDVVWRQGLVFGGLAVAGSIAGSRASVLVPAHVLMLLFGALLLVVGGVMVRSALAARRAEGSAPEVPDALAGDLGPDDAVVDAVASEAVVEAIQGGAAQGDAVQGDSGPAAPPAGTARWLRLVTAATVTGLLTGFFGVGGGFIVVPVLVLVLGLGMRQASGTSLVVMVLASASGLLARIGTPVVVDWPVTLLFAAGSMAGGLLGGPVARRARPATLSLAFALLLFCAGLVTLGLTLADFSLAA